MRSFGRSLLCICFVLRAFDSVRRFCSVWFGSVRLDGRTRNFQKLEVSAIYMSESTSLHKYR